MPWEQYQKLTHCCTAAAAAAASCAMQQHGCTDVLPTVPELQRMPAVTDSMVVMVGPLYTAAATAVAAGHGPGMCRAAQARADSW